MRAQKGKLVRDHPDPLPVLRVVGEPLRGCIELVAERVEEPRQRSGLLAKCREVGWPPLQVQHADGPVAKQGRCPPEHPELVAFDVDLCQTDGPVVKAQQVIKPGHAHRPSPVAEEGFAVASLRRPRGRHDAHASIAPAFKHGAQPVPVTERQLVHNDSGVVAVATLGGPRHDRWDAVEPQGSLQELSIARQGLEGSDLMAEPREHHGAGSDVGAHVQDPAPRRAEVPGKACQLAARMPSAPLP
mmetsp:Transcript_89262/g.289025  ORF Transcript_89262/g.289025 Transcript_89262/m.289025 type:complete len:244 (-) Transcript_89262:582-1313(-)